MLKLQHVEARQSKNKKFRNALKIKIFLNFCEISIRSQEVVRDSSLSELRKGYAIAI